MSEWKCDGVEFKVGDAVLIARTDGPYTMGDKYWDNIWVKDMDNAVGSVFYIDDIDNEGAHFYYDPGAGIGPANYAYPLSALENLTTKSMQWPEGAVEVS
jgi:hypothetical protein